MYIRGANCYICYISNHLIPDNRSCQEGNLSSFIYENNLYDTKKGELVENHCLTNQIKILEHNDSEDSRGFRFFQVS